MNKTRLKVIRGRMDNWPVSCIEAFIDILDAILEPEPGERADFAQHGPYRPYTPVEAAALLTKQVAVRHDVACTYTITSVHIYAQDFELCLDGKSVNAAQLLRDYVWASPLGMPCGVKIE